MSDNNMDVYEQFKRKVSDSAKNIAKEDINDVLAYALAERAEFDSWEWPLSDEQIAIMEIRNKEVIRLFDVGLLRLTEAYVKDVLALGSGIEILPDPQLRSLNTLLNYSEATRLAALDQAMIAITGIVDSVTKRFFEELPEAERAEAQPLIDMGAMSVPEMDSISTRVAERRKPRRPRSQKTLASWLERYEELRTAQPDLTLKAFAKRRGLNYRSLVSLRTEHRNAEKTANRGKAPRK